MPRKTNAQIAEALIATRGMVAVAARKLGVERKTIYNRLDKSPKLREVIEAARDETTDTAELALFRAIQAGEPWAVKYYLDSFGKGRGYGETKRVELTGKDGGPVNAQPIVILPPKDPVPDE